MRSDEIKEIVRKEYAKFAMAGAFCCSGAHSCCGTAPAADELGKRIGYSDEDLKNVPDDANLGLGCGNPVALASLKEGEVVLDLGCGAGFDFFLAAGQVGEGGKVIGEDVGVLAEDVFPVDFVALDPTAKAIIEGLQLSEEELADLVHSVVSMKVEAFKPDPIHAG